MFLSNSFKRVQYSPLVKVLKVKINSYEPWNKLVVCKNGCSTECDSLRGRDMKFYFISMTVRKVEQASLFPILKPSSNQCELFFYRVFLPTLEEYFSEAIEQADPDAMVEDEYK